MSTQLTELCCFLIESDLEQHRLVQSGLFTFPSELQSNNLISIPYIHSPQLSGRAVTETFKSQGKAGL